MLPIVDESCDESSPSTTVNRSSSWPGESKELLLLPPSLDEGGGIVCGRADTIVPDGPSTWGIDEFWLPACHFSKFMSTVVELPELAAEAVDKGSDLDATVRAVVTWWLFPLQDVAVEAEVPPKSFMSMVEL